MSDHADGLKRLSAESLWIAFAGQFGSSSWSFRTGETELDRIGGMSFGASSKDCLWLSKVSVALPRDAKWDDRNHDQSSYDALLNPSNPRHEEGPPPNWYSEREAQTPQEFCTTIQKSTISQQALRRSQVKQCEDAIAALPAEARILTHSALEEHRSKVKLRSNIIK